MALQKFLQALIVISTLKAHYGLVVLCALSLLFGLSSRLQTGYQILKLLRIERIPGVFGVLQCRRKLWLLVERDASELKRIPLASERPRALAFQDYPVCVLLVLTGLAFLARILFTVHQTIYGDLLCLLLFLVVCAFWIRFSELKDPRTPNADLGIVVDRT